MRSLRRRCARLIEGIETPVPFDAQALCAQVGQRLRRSIRLVPADLPASGPCGLVLSTAHAHYLCYDSGTSPLHQQHIIAHELGHLLAGHESTAPVSVLLPTLDPAMVRQALARRPGHDDLQEREAEMIAELLLQASYRWTPADPAPATDDPRSRIVARIEGTIGR